MAKISKISVLFKKDSKEAVLINIGRAMSLRDLYKKIIENETCEKHRKVILSFMNNLVEKYEHDGDVEVETDMTLEDLNKSMEEDEDEDDDK